MSTRANIRPRGDKPRTEYKDLPRFRKLVEQAKHDKRKSKGDKRNG